MSLIKDILQIHDCH